MDNIEDVIAKVQLNSNLMGSGYLWTILVTGYSSLAYLKRLPFDQLKIDCSFVRDIVENASSRAIAQSILSLGKAMGLKVIAEGVETEEQRDCLAQLGCQSFQGYLFSCPLPLDEFELLLPVFRDVLSTIQILDNSFRPLGMLHQATKPVQFCMSAFGRDSLRRLPPARFCSNSVPHVASGSL